MLGLSLAAYVRRLVMSTISARAWWSPPMMGAMTVGAVRSNGASLMRRNDPDFILERVSEAAYRFRVYVGSDGSPLMLSELQTLNIFSQLKWGRDRDRR